MTVDAIRQLVALLFLGGSAIDDVRHKSVHIILPVFGMLAGIILFAFDSEIKFQYIPLYLLPGLFFVVLNFALGGCVGIGDGIVLLALGSICGFSDTVSSILHGLIYSGVVALFLLIKKKSKDTTIPFLPFLLAGYVTVLAMTIEI